MRNKAVRFTIWGTRSSVPSTTAGRFGFHTTCFTLETPGALVIIDAGTGLETVHRDVVDGSRPRPIRMILTHAHLDHISGLPPFPPLYARGRPIPVMAAPAQLARIRAGVRTILSPPLWPVPWQQSCARLRFTPLPPAGHPWRIGPARLTWCPVWHPQGCIALRIEAADRTLVVATDREPGRPAFDAPFRDFCRAADWLILDAQYTPQEALQRHGWGHGNWQEAASLARECAVGSLVLTHHDQHRDAAGIDAIVRAARRIFPATRAATSGMRFVLG
ncbi:MAG: MBL fold metallo-hydrolase [Kiritimatiellia bacterium]